MSVTITDLKISGGPEIKQHSTVVLLYKVALTKEDLKNGKYLESTYSPDRPVEIRDVSEENLLLGVYEGILGMRGGGSQRYLIIPPELGYGKRGYGNVPPNATLHIEVCVVSVEN